MRVDGLGEKRDGPKRRKSNERDRTMTNATKATNTSDSIADAAKDLADTAKSKAASVAENAKEGAADRAAKEADNVRRAGAAFEDNPLAREAANRIADNLSHVAHALRDSDLATLKTDVTEFARRNPVVFFGGAAALGFLAARSIKASERAEPWNEEELLAEPVGEPNWGQM